jgi:septal ring factor EnvC (AmiA/AmiB activator)
MQLFEGYTAGELDRVLTVSRWVAALSLLLTIGAMALNQWLSYRIAAQQKVERDSGKTRLAEAEKELRQLRERMSSVTSSVDKLTTSRKLSATQIEDLKNSLAKAEKGHVVVTYLTIEWDAEDYAKQLAKILEEAGYRVTLSEHLWMSFEQGDVFLTSKDPVLPRHAQALQEAFASIGLAVPALPPGKIATELGVSIEDAVLVVSTR